MDDMIEERFRKIENEELLKIFPIHTGNRYTKIN